MTTSIFSWFIYFTHPHFVYLYLHHLSLFFLSLSIYLLHPLSFCLATLSLLTLYFHSIYKISSFSVTLSFSIFGLFPHFLSTPNLGPFTFGFSVCLFVACYNIFNVKNAFLFLEVLFKMKINISLHVPRLCSTKSKMVRIYDFLLWHKRILKLLLRWKKKPWQIQDTFVSSLQFIYIDASFHFSFILLILVSLSFVFLQSGLL